MTKYLVKVTYVAKENNKNFAGETQVWYKGKKGRTVACDGGSFYGYPKAPQDDYFTRVYGYDRLCDAKRSYSYKNCADEDAWYKSVEIVSVEVRG